MRKSIMADAILDFEFKDHFRVIQENKDWGQVVPVLQFALRWTLQLAPTRSCSQKTHIKEKVKKNMDTHTFNF